MAYTNRDLARDYFAVVMQNATNREIKKYQRAMHAIEQAPIVLSELYEQHGNLRNPVILSIEGFPLTQLNVLERILSKSAEALILDEVDSQTRKRKSKERIDKIEGRISVEKEKTYFGEDIIIPESSF